MDPAALMRSLTYIQANLDGDLSMRALAAAAGCSGPYFARRFAALMEETPKRYTARLRLERAALRLVLLDDGVFDIALDCGFSSHETFTRAFRRRFGVAPLAFRRAGRLPGASGAAAEHELPQRAIGAGGAPASLSSTSVRTLQPISLACIRHTGPYEQVPLDLWDALADWARRHGVPAPYVLLGIAHDAPGITAPENLRFDAAIRVPGEFRSARRSRVTHDRFAGGLFALTTSVGPFSSLPGAYAEIFRRVRSDRTLECIGLPCLEFYRVNRVAANLAVVNTEIGIPVRRRRLRSGAAVSRPGRRR